jgi:hypothetical protein
VFFTFDGIGEKIKFFSSIDDCVYWCNCERPHGALDLERAETLIEAY